MKKPLFLFSCIELAGELPAGLELVVVGESRAKPGSDGAELCRFHFNKSMVRFLSKKKITVDLTRLSFSWMSQPEKDRQGCVRSELYQLKAQIGSRRIDVRLGPDQVHFLARAAGMSSRAGLGSEVQIIKAIFQSQATVTGGKGGYPDGRLG